MMMNEQKRGVRLNRLRITNYKKLDFLEIDFPSPVMEGDADIFVFGSKNGGGKTSVLECCALVLLAGMTLQAESKSENILLWDKQGDFDSNNALIKAGQQQAIIQAEFAQNEQECTVYLVITRDEHFYGTLEGDKILFFGSQSIQSAFAFFYRSTTRYAAVLDNILAVSSEPCLIPPLLHFNSYRKVQETKPELGMMASGVTYPHTPISSFKLEILRLLMGQAALFEGFDQKKSDVTLSQLNRLVQRYAGGKIEHLRPLPDNKVDIRINPSAGGESFSFDGLSSGQKEMIATLFLVWQHSQEQPCIVLIDEPELHLNAEWHGDFVRQLQQLAPHNQYILATHSETMFRSVDEANRAVLVPDDVTL
jgi:hypothetical protein